MNIKLLCKKTYKSLLALMIMFSMFPQFTETVVAEETTIPVEQFATVDQLKSFNTNDNDGEVKAVKVYFGNNNQQWWIAGSQDENSITLFAASPLATDQVFEPNYDQNKSYSDEWNCDYTSTGGSNPSDVYPNHYGASPLRNTLKNLETSYFTSKEQGLMKDTTIYTNDTKNNSVYSTTDKLYLAYGDIDDDQYITVGTNSKDSLNSGLHIDNSYWGNSFFWLRAPYEVENLHYVLHTGDGYVDGNLAIEGRALLPAFELDMSSVVFASTASSATTTGTLPINEAFTLRYKTDRKVSALVSYDKSKVTLSGVWAGINLVVQNKDGAKAKRIMMEKEVSAADMGLDSFANCKVWLEYTNTSERKTYATLATEEQGYDVNITASEGLTVTNGVQGVAQGSAITDITVAVADGYYLPDGYTNTIQGLNGLNVKDVTQTGFTISGTPTNDVNIVLPEARRDQFVVEGGTKDVDYTYQNGILTFVKDGNYVLKHPSGITDTSDRVVIADNFKGELTLDNISIGLGFVPCIDVASNANLTLIIKGKNSLGVHDDNAAAIQFMNVTENGSLTIDSGEPVGELTLHGRNGPGLGSPGYNSAYTKNIYINGGIIDASSDNGIGIGSYSDSNPSEITINGGTIKGSKIGSKFKGSKAIINGGNIQNSINVETEINGGFVKGNIEDNEIKNSAGQTVYKANITLEDSDVKSLKVDGNNYNFPAQPGINDIWLYLPSGTHTVTHENSEGKISEYTIIINENGTVTHVNAWEKELTISGWTYGQNPNTPTAKSKFGDVVFSYSDKKNGAYTSTKPTKAGTYYVKATVEGTLNYKGLVSEPVEFTILKANTTLTITSSVDKTYDGNKVDEPTYQTSGSTGLVSIKYQEYKDNKWNDLSKVPTNVGKYRVVVKIEEDTNYSSALDTKEFTISKADNTWTNELTIKGWTYGETANKPSASAVFGTVEYTYSESKDGAYVDTVPTNAGTYYVKATVEGTSNYTDLTSDPVKFTISKADTTITFIKDNIDKVYDSKPIDTPEVTKTGSTKDLTFKWSKKDGTELTDKPSDVGEYTLTVSVDEDDNYNSASVSKDFVITIADNTWIDVLSINGWTYGEKANKPNASATFGTVKYTYSESKDGTYTSTIPTNAGSYYVKAEVIGNENYKGLTSDPVEFTILKANTTLTITSSVDKSYDGNTVSDPKYKLEGNTNTVTIGWLNKDGAELTVKPSDVGEYKVVVKVDEDTNYNSASDTKEFTISKANNTWIDELTISGWTYGQNPNTPTAKSKFGDVVFSYSDKKNGAYTSTKPTKAGTYYVKATVEGTLNYKGLVSEPVEFTILKANTTLTITSSVDKTYDGNKVDEPTYQTSGSTGLVSIKYQEYKDNKWNDLSKVPTNVGKYRVVVKIEEDTNYSSALDTKEFTISKADNTWTNELTIKGWTYGETANKPSASAVFGTVEYTYSESKDGAYVDTVPTNAGTYYVKATVEGTSNYTDLTSDPVKFTISKADTTITFIKDNIDKVYDSKPIDTPEVTKTGSTKDLTFKWSKKDGTELTDKPSDVGEYTLTVSVDEDDNYNSASVSKDFVITIADNTWIDVLSINGWTYGEKANKPNASATFGTVKYTYSESKDGTYTSTIPTNAGSYYVKAEVEGTSNYKGLVSEAVEFTISKADPVLKSLSTLTIEQGKSLSNLGLPEGYKWKNPNYECKDLGSHTYKAVFTPKDSVNYNTLDVDVSVNVIAKTEVNNPTPSVDSNVTTNSNNNNNNSYVGNGGSTTSNVLLDELKEVVNKSEYKAYEKAYTKESYDNYLDAFENAEKVLNNKNSSKEEIKVALDKLNEAISNLKVDKSNLQASLVEFEELDSKKYSEASYKVLLSAIEKAKAIMEDEKASPEEIVNAIEELNNAYSSLQSAEPKVEAPKKSSVGKVALITTVTAVVVAGGGSYLWILLKKFRGMK